MSQGDANRTLLRFPGQEREFWVARPSAREYALIDELSFVRREAQAEANVAYADWRDRPSGERYVVYRAAQDRADAAQDALARWTCEMYAYAAPKAAR
jgi:acyl-CoA reductase-like NAD-dependent aldehyde dehydrogenase